MRTALLVLLCGCEATSISADLAQSGDLAQSQSIDLAQESDPDLSQSADLAQTSAQPDMARAAAATFTVSGNQILDPCGQPFIARGINHPTIYVDRNGAALPEIKKTGANIVRIFWYAGNGVPITAAEPVIKAAADNGMVAILGMWDSTCGWNLDTIQSYWTSADAVALIQKYQRNFWLNIANEASPPDGATYLSKYSSIIQAVRGAGIHVPIVIDAGGCGRDSNVLLDNGAALTTADPEHDVIFDWHFYDALSHPAITAVLQKSIDNHLPFIIGEFADKSPPGCGAALDYTFLIAEAQRLGLGWLAWSWGDNDANTDWNSDCGEFDMTSTFAESTLRNWGLSVAVSDTNSIHNTASPAHGLGGTCP